MIAQVTVTNSLNLTTLIAIATIFLGFAAWLIPKVFKLAQQIIKEILDLKVWIAEYQAKITLEQTMRLEACIHQIPGHPENQSTRTDAGAAAPAAPADPPARQ